MCLCVLNINRVLDYLPKHIWLPAPSVCVGPPFLLEEYTVTLPKMIQYLLFAEVVFPPCTEKTGVDTQTCG